MSALDADPRLSFCVIQRKDASKCAGAGIQSVKDRCKVSEMTGKTQGLRILDKGEIHRKLQNYAMMLTAVCLTSLQIAHPLHLHICTGI